MFHSGGTNGGSFHRLVFGWLVAILAVCFGSPASAAELGLDPETTTLALMIPFSLLLLAIIAEAWRMSARRNMPSRVRSRRD